MSTLLPRYHVFAIAVLALALAALGAACSGDDDDDSSNASATASPSETATAPAEGTNGASYATYPPDKETGIASLDAVIDRVEQGKPLDDLIQFVRVSCGQVTASGSGDPPDCRLGEAVGQVVDALPTTTCDRYYTRSDELAPVESDLLDGDPRLYAVYRSTPKDGTDAFPAGEYVAVFVNDKGEGRLVHVDGDHVVRVGLGCAANGSDLTEGHTDFVLAPLGS